jgi:glycogen phosphorylase
MCSNPLLAELLIDRLAGSEDWLRDLRGLETFYFLKDDPTFIREFIKVRELNKTKLSSLVKKDLSGVMTIGHTKRPTSHKRHILSVIGIVDAYLRGDKS